VRERRRAPSAQFRDAASRAFLRRPSWFLGARAFRSTTYAQRKRNASSRPWASTDVIPRSPPSGALYGPWAAILGALIVWAVNLVLDALVRRTPRFG
jgi:hypothetical protein